MRIFVGIKLCEKSEKKRENEKNDEKENLVVENERLEKGELFGVNENFPAKKYLFL